MGKRVAVLHWLMLTLGLAAAQAGTAFAYIFLEGHLEKKKHQQAFKVRF